MVEQLLQVVSEVVVKAAQSGADSASTIIGYEPQMPECMFSTETNNQAGGLNRKDD